MRLIHRFNQGAFTRPLNAPNNTGVCFSLSIHWLTNNYDPVLLDLIGNDAEAAYADGSPYRVQLIQAAANEFADRPAEILLLIAMVIQAYPQIRHAAAVGGHKALNFDDIYAHMVQAQYDDNIIWLREAGMGRGHVVAYNRAEGSFFDANEGIFTVENDIQAEVASFLEVRYARIGYNQFQIFSLDLF